MKIVTQAELSPRRRPELSQGYSKSKSRNFLITLFMGMEKGRVLFTTEASTKADKRAGPGGPLVGVSCEQISLWKW